MKGSSKNWAEVDCVDEADAAIQCADRIAQLLAKSLSEHASTNLFVSGGKSPIPVFARLCTSVLPWEKVYIHLVDERWALGQPADQNQALVHQHLLQNNAKAANFFSLLSQPELNDCIQGANVSTASIDAPDIVLLGMGLDGHTASLFPDATEYSTGLTTHNHYLAIQPGSAPYSRISMSLQWLASAKNILLFIPGPEKRNAFDHFVAEGKAESPLRPLLKLRGDCTTIFVSGR